MKICLITESIYPLEIGGMQKHSFELARQFAKQGVELTLIYGINNEKALTSSDFSDQPIQLIPIPFPAKGKFPGHYLRRSYAFSKMAWKKIDTKGSEFDLIYIQGFSGGYFLDHKNQLGKTKLLINFHGLNMFQPVVGWKNKIIAKMLARTVKKQCKQADFVISLGGQLTDLLNEIGTEKEKIIVQPNAIDEAIIRTSAPQIPKKRIKFIFIGRNDKIKATAQLISAIKQLNHDQVEFHFVGPFDGIAIEKEQIHFHGEIKNQEQLLALLDQCDVIICTSISEGMPTVILEAMARGLAILSTKVGAIPELLSEQNGRWIRSSSAKDILSAIHDFLKLETQVVEKMKTTSVKNSENFTWSQNVRDFLNRFRNN